MKTLHDYLKTQIERTDPHSIIDHAIRAELHSDGRLSFYIHAQGVDSTTPTFWITEDDEIVEKRQCDEPLSAELRQKVLNVTIKWGAFWGAGNNQVLCVPHGPHPSEVIGAIETIMDVNANYRGSDDDYLEYQPRIGSLQEP